MSQERPDALLKSALEKIVYFEARAQQLTNDLDQACSERERLRTDLAHASQREIDLRRVIAELEVRSTRAHAEREESANLAEALRRERAELLGKILEASRLNTDVSDPFDLASFIAELRSEVLLRREHAEGAPHAMLVAAAPVAVVDAPAVEKPSHITNEAEALNLQGRLTVSKAELASLERAFPFAGRSEETLFGFSVRELTAPDASARARAAERLTALAHPAAAPALATALHAERDASVKVALLTALSTLAKVEAIPVILPQLSAAAPEVRIAALKALLKLDPTQAGPHLAAAVKDPDSAVRRRASLLALGLHGPSALELGETAIRDENPDVRSLAALVLGASGMESARTWLMQAMRDPEVRVRRSASQALSRLLGQDVSQLVDLDEAQRRREVRRLSQVPSNPVKAKLVASLPKVAAQVATNGTHAPASQVTPRHDVVRSTVAQAAPTHEVVVAAPVMKATVAQVAPTHDVVVAAPVVERTTVAQVAPSHVVSHAPVAQDAPTSVVAHAPAPVVARVVETPRPIMVAPRAPASASIAVLAAPARTAVAVIEEEAPAPVLEPQLLDGVMTELRAAIRGQPADALAGALDTSLETVRAACGALMQQGQVVRRGHKYFVA
ncbi:MAG: HEAT repeat domain-containing protein [Myxococcales bacterium]|nr:HEAT repeat domain-containing protein [Myxococcales bacterium]